MVLHLEVILFKKWASCLLRMAILSMEKMCLCQVSQARSCLALFSQVQYFISDSNTWSKIRCTPVPVARRATSQDNRQKVAPEMVASALVKWNVIVLLVMVLQIFYLNA